jgi:hydroxymethylglutaryl-CoA lyase
LRTGIDLTALLAVHEQVAESLKGEPMYGFLPDAGIPLGHQGPAATELQPVGA